MNNRGIDFLLLRRWKKNLGNKLLKIGVYVIGTFWPMTPFKLWKNSTLCLRRQHCWSIQWGVSLLSSVEIDYDYCDSAIQTSSFRCVFASVSVSAVGELGKLILQVADPLFLRQNCGFQVLKLLQQPLKQLRLDRMREGEEGKTE